MRILILAILLIIALTYYFYKKSNTIIEGQCGGICGLYKNFEPGSYQDDTNKLICQGKCSDDFIGGGSRSGYNLSCRTVTIIPAFMGRPAQTATQWHARRGGLANWHHGAVFKVPKGERLLE